MSFPTSPSVEEGPLHPSAATPTIKAPENLERTRRETRVGQEELKKLEQEEVILPPSQRLPLQDLYRTRMVSPRLKRVILAFCTVIGCLFSTAANQEARGANWKPCESGPLKPEPEAARPTQVVRMSVAEANTVMRVRRSPRGTEGPSAPLQDPQWYTESNGDTDRRPYSRTARNFMRFGRGQSTGSDDVVCLPVVGDEEPDVTSSEAEEKFALSKDGDEGGRFSRFGRDQGQYDYNGKPFMRFGKRRFGRSPASSMGSTEGNVVCFRSTGDGREKGKRFMRFGRGALTLDAPDSISQKEDGASDSGDEKSIMRFGKAAYSVAIGSGTDYEKQDDQSKI